MFAGGQVVFLGALPFSHHLSIDSAQNEWNNLEPKSQKENKKIKKKKKKKSKEDNSN